MTLSDRTAEGVQQGAVEDGIDESLAPDRVPPAPTVVRLAPTADVGRRSKFGRRARHVGSRYALLGVWLAIAAFYGTVMPDKFLNTSTVEAIFGSQSALLLLAVSALCTFVVGEFDLSFASVMGLTATIIPTLTSTHGVSLPLACLIGIGAALACGCVNAFFVVKLNVPSLIVTLGTASLILGMSELISGAAVSSVSNKTFSNLAVHRVAGLPLSFYYGVAICIAFAYILSWTPLGRHVIFVGANREVARLAGVNVNRIRAGSYILASLVSGVAGMLLVATVGGFDPTGANVYLLPALAAVFLGTAVVQPGQFNPMGTWFSIYFLATGILGLQLLGYTGWVQDAFYGGGLVLAVTAASFVRAKTSSR